METNDAVAALEALAQESRLGIFRLLVEAGPAGIPAGLIAEQMKLPPPTLSFHLAQLKHSGLIGCTRDGRSLIYSANFAEMDGLIGFLTDNCCGGDAAQCAPARRTSKIKSERKSANPRSAANRPIAR